MTLVIIFTIFMIMLGVGGSMAIHKAKTSGPSKPVDASLSVVARQLIKEYNTLPEESKPFENIVDILQSLDSLHSIDAVERENHFNDNYFDLDPKLSFGGYHFTWEKSYSSGWCDHREPRCKFSEYVRLHRAIEAVKKSVVDKERAVLESRHAGDAGLINELETRLADEASLNKDFVREFKQLP